MLYAGYPDDDSINVIIEEKSDPRRVRSIDNSYTSRSKCSGYCSYTMHPGYLKSTHITEHKCQEKECCFFYCLRANEKKPKKKPDEPIGNSFLPQIIEATKKFEGMRVIRVDAGDNNILNVKYVSIADYDFVDVIKRLSNTIGMEIQMHRLNLDYEKSAALIFR